MRHKNTIIFTLLLIVANASFSQTQQVSLNSQPSRAVGQPQLFPESGAPNRVEGREFWSPQSVALDTSAKPPILYVSDLNNNRILAWKNATQFNNGQPADLVIGQQDFFSTGADGPAGTPATGLFSPTGIVVDAKGNLYVADSGNNRILRYPQPFGQQGQVQPDMWLGQPTISSRTANYTGLVSAQGLALGTSNALFQSGLAFDAAGNLWASDPGNARVIRYPVGSLACTQCGNIAADIVVGQSNLSSTQNTQLTNNLNSYEATNQFGLVDGIAFDSNGYLYVTDTVAGVQGRVLVFTHPSGQTGNASADRIMGVVPNSELQIIANQSSNPQADENTFIGQTALGDPSGVFLLPDNSVGVVDSGYNRILIFPPYAQWPAIGTHFSPQANGVIGQPNLQPTNLNPNQETTGLSYGTPVPSAATVAQPGAAVFLAATKELFICDTGNNRVIVVPQTTTPAGTGFGTATRLLGQDSMTQFSANLVEGKEFDFFIPGQYADTSIALDTTGSVPHLWVSDPRNHRVLGFKDARTMSPASVADIVLGQPDLHSAVCNYSSNSTTSGSISSGSSTQSSLCFPFGIAVDSQGGLYVADGGNSRVLHFPNPWNSGQTALEKADLVLGQNNFGSAVASPTATNMGEPYGVAISGNSGLLVTDIQFNRVLYFKFTGNGTFNPGADNGRAATSVFGQGNFTTVSKPAGSGQNQFNLPHNIACDTSGQFYVTDTANNRVLVFGDPNNPSTSGTAILNLPNLNAPRGIYVNAGTGEIWVANTNSGTLVRYPKFDTLQFNATPTATINDVVNNVLIPTIAVAQDQYGDLFVADGENRVAVFYQGFTAVNAASSLALPLAPGMMGTLYPLASTTQFGANTATASTPKWPTNLGDIQVNVNGSAAPLYYISPGQINFFVPQAVPVNANAEVEVVQVSTGQVLGAQQISISTIAPAIYTTCQANQTGSLREACVLNQDGTVNSSANPAPRGSIVSIFGTGQGLVSNAPADGAPAPSSPLAGAMASTRVAMGSCFIDNCGPNQPGDVGTATSAGPQWVTFSGLTPGYVGLWQINAQIPMSVVPSSASSGVTPLIVTLNNQASSGTGYGFETYFYVK